MNGEKAFKCIKFDFILPKSSLTFVDSQILPPLKYPMIKLFWLVVFLNAIPLLGFSQGIPSARNLR